MNQDPTGWIIGASLLSACIGFMACALFCSRRIREERNESYWRGYGACNREHHKQNPKL